MPLRSYKATSPGLRQMTRSTFEEVTTDQPYKPLLEPQTRGSGRNEDPAEDRERTASDWPAWASLPNGLAWSQVPPRKYQRLACPERGGVPALRAPLRCCAAEEGLRRVSNGVPAPDAFEAAL